MRVQRLDIETNYNKRKALQAYQVMYTSKTGGEAAINILTSDIVKPPEGNLLLFLEYNISTNIRHL